MAPGECREVVRHCEAAIALIPEGWAQERFGFGSVQGSFVRNTLAIALGALGRFAEGFGRLREAMHIAEEAGHVYSLLFPLFGLGTLSVEVDTAEAHYRQALALADELGMRPLVAHCHLGLGKLYRRTGQREQAREQLATATTMYRGMEMAHWLEQAEAETAAG